MAMAQHYVIEIMEYICGLVSGSEVPTTSIMAILIDIRPCFYFTFNH